MHHYTCTCTGRSEPIFAKPCLLKWACTLKYSNNNKILEIHKNSRVGLWKSTCYIILLEWLLQNWSLQQQKSSSPVILRPKIFFWLTAEKTRSALWTSTAGEFRCLELDYVLFQLVYIEEGNRCKTSCPKMYTKCKGNSKEKSNLSALYSLDLQGAYSTNFNPACR